MAWRPVVTFRGRFPLLRFLRTRTPSESSPGSMASSSGFLCAPSIQGIPRTRPTRLPHVHHYRLNDKVLFRTSGKIMKRIAHTKQLAGLATRYLRWGRWLPIKELQWLPCQAQYIFMATSSPRFFLRKIFISSLTTVAEEWSK
jgi:hypothetical protein